MCSPQIPASLQLAPQLFDYDLDFPLQVECEHEPGLDPETEEIKTHGRSFINSRFLSFIFFSLA